jgi:hypothetical protein
MCDDVLPNKIKGFNFISHWSKLCPKDLYFLLKKLPSISMQGLSLLDDIWMKKLRKFQNG